MLFGKAKAFGKFATCISVSNNLCEKLAPSLELPIILNDSLSVISGSFFVADFNLLSCELDNIKFTVLY